jgi:hypothetical protein
MKFYKKIQHQYYAGVNNFKKIQDQSQLLCSKVNTHPTLVHTYHKAIWHVEFPPLMVMSHLDFLSHSDRFFQVWAVSNKLHFQILLFAHVTKLMIM